MGQERFAVFLDLDGTLSQHGEIPARNLAAVAAVRQRGNYVFLNTGRARANVPRQVLDQLDLDGLVTGLGSYITHAGQLLFSAAIPRPLLWQTADFLWERGYQHVLEGEAKLLYGHLAAPAGLPFARTLTGKAELRETYQTERISKISVNGQLQPADQEWLSSSYTVFQHETYAEFVLPGRSKADGMRRVLTHLDLAKSASLAMGDSINDLDMLQAAAVSVAMGNASPEVKAVCSMVTAPAQDAGVALALEQLLLQ